MRIGELAKRSGVTLRTIRYYIEEGLLPPPPLRGKYGDFDESYLQRLELIRHLKEERLSLPAIRRRLAKMGLVPSGAEPSSEVDTEGIFRSRFAEETGLTSEQVARLETLGLLESQEGLLSPAAIPLARAAARLLARGATVEDIAKFTEQIRQEAALHRRLLDQADPPDPLARSLQWQEQMGALDSIRQTLLWRWAHPREEVTP